mgnify:CR=1 FL=1
MSLPSFWGPPKGKLFFVKNRESQFPYFHVWACVMMIAWFNDLMPFSLFFFLYLSIWLICSLYSNLSYSPQWLKALLLVFPRFFVGCEWWLWCYIFINFLVWSSCPPLPLSMSWLQPFIKFSLFISVVLYEPQHMHVKICFIFGGSFNPYSSSSKLCKCFVGFTFSKH